MRLSIPHSLTSLFLVLTATLHADESTTPSPIAKDAKLTLLADSFKFTEGPAADAKGEVYFTDQPNDRILKWSFAEKKLSTFMEPCGRANGLFFDPEGRLLACADEHNQLWRITIDDQSVEKLLTEFKGKRFNGPNDVWVRPDGGIYFTDPFYKRDYWKDRGAQEQPGRCVYFLAPDSTEPNVVISDFKTPNGIVGKADESKLYVADIEAGKTYVYHYQKEGSLTDKTEIAPMGSDGMTVDTEGNVYLTGKGVSVFSPEAKQIAHIDVPEGWTANVCFAGPERKTLFITAMDSVYSLEMNVAGAKQTP